jgi:type IX secretion system PorP/SprF family membrane protein
MKKAFIIFTIFFSVNHYTIKAQGLHFSQFFNAPLLLSPANTALMPDNDYRVGVHYRNQWSSIPVPFNTMAAFADFKVAHNQEGNNWLGLGAAVFNDRAGNGSLSLLKMQISAAYHLQMGMSSMLSVGLGAAYVQRSVNYAALTFDAQWDGMTFNSNWSQNEHNAVQKTSYPDLSAGINYAYFPNENVYIKFGVGLLHVNQPNESFYRMDNKLGIRPTANFNLLLKANDNLITEVSAYYTNQKSASELVYGALFSYNVASTSQPTILLFGVYQRFATAIIPTMGLEWNNIRATVNMDVPTSSVSNAAGVNGALELSIIYKGLYGGSHGKNRSAYNCPRF